MFLTDLQRAFAGTALEPACAELARIADAAWQTLAHGDRDRWEAALAGLPAIEGAGARLETGTVQAPPRTPPGAQERAVLEASLRALTPWRKGPFSIRGLHIDTEWRSDWKWSRLQGRITSLQDRLVLDVGCGNGYYGYRMLGDGARAVLGVDPFLLFHYQFRALQRYLAQERLAHLPVPFEALPAETALFDTAFSMGVLYHRRDPLEHLQRLRGCLRPGGELVLETLIVAAGPSLWLEKGERYARMRNVWCLPNLPDVTRWLSECGFDAVQCLDTTATATSEQRSTAWMPFESLRESLDPADPAKTVEGHPAPLRAVIRARAA